MERHFRSHRIGSLSEGERHKDKSRSAFVHVKGNDEFLDRTTAEKLFSFLLCHGEDCRLELSIATKRLHKFTDRSVDQKKALDFIRSFREMFEVKTVDGKQFIEARTTVRLCDAFQETGCRFPSCRHLHICRFFLQGSCSYGDECKKPHSFDIPGTRTLLQQHELSNLPPDALRNLFKKVLNEKIIRHASTTSGPGPCKFYNKGECKNGDKCGFLHVCEHYVNGDCKFGEGRCKRFHHFDTSHSRKILASRKLGYLRGEHKILSFLRSGSETEGSSSRKRGRQLESEDDGIGGRNPYDNGSMHNLSPEKKMKWKAPKPSSNEAKKLTSETTEANEKLEICGFNLRGKCQYGEKCNARHTSLPYEWQYTYFSPGSVSWGSFAAEDNCGIEKSFCNCEENFGNAKSKDRLLPISIDFQAMNGKVQDQQQQSDCDLKGTGPQVQIRRLSTISSVLAASGHVFRTKWKWYWKDEHDKWQSYDDGKADANSEKIEQDYQSDTTEKKHTFSTSLNKYTLYFDNPNQLYQQNDKHGTKRDVRRRPAQFLDKQNMKQILQEFKRSCQRPSISSTKTSETVSTVPPHWAPLDPSEDFKVFDVSEVLHHEEFTKVKTQFLATMPGHTVKSIKRVQNAALWEDYERQKSRIMKKNSGCSPDERWLFHGTSKDTVDPICQQGFDWRLSGKHGTAYGKGSYFASEASYSHTYSTQVHSFGCNSRMFLAKVIVGSYVLGNNTTQRPPPKNTFDPLSTLHDSCVNAVKNPTIFVVFERSQAYPYYIIEYGN